MYRINLTPSGNYATKVEITEEEIENIITLVSEGDPVILVDELPDDLNDIFMSAHTNIIDVNDGELEG